MRKSIASKILLVTLLAVVLLVSGLVFVMQYFMNSLTNSVLLGLMQPMAKTAAQSVEGSLHVLAEGFFFLQSEEALISSSASQKEIEAVLDKARSGSEFVWLGLYGTDGTLITGSDDCPHSITGRDIYIQLGETRNLVIEDTSVGNSGLQILMGIPIGGGSSREQRIPRYYLVGSYRYDLLNDVLGNINIGENSTAFMINEAGTIIAHRNQGKVYGREHISASLGDSDEFKEIFQLMVQGQTGSAYLQGPDGHTFISYSPVRGTLWSLGIHSPRKDFMAAERYATFISVFITIIALIVFTGFFIILIRRILTTPMHAIAEEAQNLSIGQFDNTISQKLAGRSDEIGVLGSAFLNMSQSIRSVVGAIGELTHAVQSGSLGHRADVSHYQGDYHLILQGINATMDVIGSHLDAMSSAFALFDGNQKPLYLNATMQSYADIHFAEYSGGGLLAYIVSSGGSGDLLPEAAAVFSPTAKSGDTYTADVSITGSQGEEHNFTLMLRRVGAVAEQNSLADPGVCVMMILNDVTMLTRAKQDAESASHAKGNFLANMSHEMRTPLNAIIGMTTIAQSTDDPERKDYCLGKIDNASNHLLGVINDILDMSKIEANKFELSCEPFSFEKMLQKVVNVINFKVEEKEQNFTVFIDSGIPPVLVSDDQRLSQVITNLLSNAVKFTPERGSIRLNSRLLEAVDGVCTLQIEVEDTGIGVTAEQSARLFSSFEQAESGTSRKFGGTGLGLAISKRIVEMMDGTIWVDSQPNEGSTFAFTVKVQYLEQELAGKLDSDVRWDNLRALAVDDAPEIREYFTLLAEQLNFDCDVASSGEEACRMIDEQGKYDIYFVDWKMPSMDGIELSRRIKEGAPEKSVVIMISATEWSTIEADAKQAGVDKFLPKPLFPSTLSDCINECLGHQALYTPDDLGDEADDFTGYRILLAEDVEINREIVLALLNPTGLEVDCAENGAEALRLFSENPQRYGLIFMDVQMPEMDGYEATRRIRSLNHPRAGKVPIIAMTANVFREDIERCIASGMNDHVGKPLDYGDVLSKLRRYLPSKSTSR